MSKTSQQVKIEQRLKRRLIFFLFISILVLFAFIARAFQIQVMEGDLNYEKSQRVITKVVALPAPRGEFFDRNYINRERAVVIVANTTQLNLIAIPSHFKGKELEEKVRLLERLLRYKTGSLTSRITREKIKNNDEIIIIENINEREHTIMADYYLNFSKFIIRQNIGRNYIMGESTAHITGFVGKPDPRDITQGIRSYQLLGKNGLEYQYDSILRGTDGEIIQIKTARGDIEEQKVLRNFVPGNNFILTIDADIQKTAYDAFGDKTGAVLVIHARTGEILAMVSKPSFDPNIMVMPDNNIRREHVLKMKADKAELNRAISTKYAPASTFKPIVALAALEEGRITESQSYFCPGHWTLKSTIKGYPDRKFHCYGVHGNNDLVNAIAQSCSVYFYQLGYKIGAEPMIKYARYFNLDEKTNIDVPGEIPGFVPSPLWKEKNFNMRWFDGDTVNLSIGQGFIETTLIGLMNFYVAIANGGIVYRPHLVKEIRYAENDEVKMVNNPEVAFEIPIARQNLDTIQRALRQVSLSGTTRYAFSGTKIAIAGKTGTAQTISTARKENISQHAWFVGYGPYQGNPDDIIVVGVFIDRGMWGASYAAPIARRVFDAWQKKLDAKTAGNPVPGEKITEKKENEKLQN